MIDEKWLRDQERYICELKGYPGHTHRVLQFMDEISQRIKTQEKEQLQPTQPLVGDPPKFRKNEAVHCYCQNRDLAGFLERGDFPREDKLQLLQLMGLTLDEYRAVSFVTDEDVQRAVENSTECQLFSRYSKRIEKLNKLKKVSQEEFTKEYLECRDTVEAARKAGYSTDTPREGKPVQERKIKSVHHIVLFSKYDGKSTPHVTLVDCEDPAQWCKNNETEHTGYCWYVMTFEDCYDKENKVN